jgi:oligosaccharide repeat unit polymerase
MYLVAFAGRVTRDLYYPPLLFTAPLTLQYWGYYFFIRKTEAVSTLTNTLYLFSILFFLMGYALTGFASSQYINSSKQVALEAFSDFNKVIKLFLFLGTIGFIWGLLATYSKGISGPYSFFVNVRLYAITHQRPGLYIYLILFLHTGVLMAVASKHHYPINKIKLWIYIMMLCICPFFAMTRIEMLLYIFSILICNLLIAKYVIKQREYSVNVIFYVVISFISLLLISSYLTDKLFLDGELFFIKYLSYPIVSFDNWIVFSKDANTYLTIYPIMKILETMGLYTFTEFTGGAPEDFFNVYTFMYRPYLDFGGIGLIVCMFFLGVFFAIVYKKVRDGNPYWIIFYSLMSYPLIISFYDYQFALISWLYYVAIFMMTKINGQIRWV